MAPTDPAFLVCFSTSRVQVTLTEAPGTAACGVLNGQDSHLSARPVDAEGFGVEAYRDSILRRIETALEDATRLRKLERLYLVGGGDLVHSDGKGKTAKGRRCYLGYHRRVPYSQCLLVSTATVLDFHTKTLSALQRRSKIAPASEMGAGVFF